MTNPAVVTKDDVVEAWLAGVNFPELAEDDTTDDTALELPVFSRRIPRRLRLRHRNQSRRSRSS